MATKKTGRRVIKFGAREKAIYKKYGAGCSLVTLSALCNVSEKTLRNIHGRQPEFQNLWEHLQARQVSEVVGHLMQQIRNGELQAILFYLKCRTDNYIPQKAPEAALPHEQGLVEEVITRRYDGSLDSETAAPKAAADSDNLFH